MEKLKFISASETATKELAKKIAQGLKKNDCLALEGCFGSGKTTFVKGLVQGLSLRKNNYVCSPSFVILKIYNGRLPVYHFDLYRLHGLKDFQDIGLFEFIGSGGVSVIEWAEKIRSLLPKNALKVRFSVLGRHKRGLQFFTTEARIERLLRKVLC